MRNGATRRPVGGAAVPSGTGAGDGVAAAVLAAGASTRMGRNKLLLKLNGETVVRRAARAAIAAGLDPVVVVTGHAHEAVAAQLRGLACRAVFNGEHESGAHTSVAAGIGAVGDTGSAAAIVMLADMPLVTPAMLRAVVASYRKSGARVVASRYGGDFVAPPILYDRRLFGELRDMDARCGREVVRRHRRGAVELAWPAAAARDLDRPEDYEWMRRALEREAAAAAATGPPWFPAAPSSAIPAASTGTAPPSAPSPTSAATPKPSSAIRERPDG